VSSLRRRGRHHHHGPGRPVVWSEPAAALAPGPGHRTGVPARDRRESLVPVVPGGCHRSWGADRTGSEIRSERCSAAGADQSRPVQGYPVQGYPVQGYPVQSCPVQSCPVQSCPVQSCPVSGHGQARCPHPAVPGSGMIRTSVCSLLMTHARRRAARPVVRAGEAPVGHRRARSIGGCAIPDPTRAQGQWP